MFIRNRTPHRVALAHGYVSADDAVASVVVETWFRVDGAHLAPAPPIPPDARAAPPDILSCAEWAGASVTVSGTVRGPPCPPFVQPVKLRAGGETRRLIVFGDRTWTLAPGGELSPSAPAPFEAIPLTFARAFGGFYDEPPGLCPLTGLPSPGGRCAYPLNEAGMGFYPDAARALGRPLPNVEAPDQLVASWDARPVPAGFSPCPSLHALRLVPADDGEASLRHQHFAPGALIFPALPPGTELAVEGVGPGPLAFAVPGFPAQVVVTPALSNPGAWATRAVHVDADAGLVAVVQGYAFSYTSNTAPRWIQVLDANPRSR